MEAHSKVDLARMSKPYTDVVWRSISSELVRGASRPCRPPFLWVHSLPPFRFLGSPFVNATNFPFILVFSSHSSPTCPFLIVWGGYSSCQSSHQSGWEKLDSMVWVWVCQAMGSTLRRWQPSPLCCSCTEFVLFFRLFLWGIGRKVVLGHILGPSRSFHCAFLAVGLLGLDFGLLIQSGLGPQI